MSLEAFEVSVVKVFLQLSLSNPKQFTATVTLANSYGFKAQCNEVVAMLKCQFASLWYVSNNYDHYWLNQIL